MSIRFSGPLPPQNDRSIIFKTLFKSVGKFCTKIKSFCDLHKNFNSISYKRLTNVRTVSKNRTENQSTKIDTFAKLGDCFEGKDKEAIQGRIDSLIQSNGGKINKELFNTIQETLKKDFNVSDADFYKAWSKAISTTQGGEVLGGKIGLKIGGKDVKLNLKFTPQAKMSGFIGDTEGLKHYSSAIQNYSLQKTGEKGNHAVNLWKQDIEVNGHNMQFLRHGCTRGGEEATKEILLNALLLQKGEDAISNWDKNEGPLELQFTNVQLMTAGHIADRKMPIEQMDAFNKLAKNQPIELKTKDGRTIKVNIGKPLLFDFGVNLQHFKGIEKVLADSQDKKTIKEQNLESFKQLFGENFPKNVKNNDGNVVFEEGSLIKKYLDDPKNGDADKAQVRTLANQILDIYKNHPEGLKENPYALPTRVLALTNLLGYASSFNCKSGKDRTGVCAMELTNLCSRMMAGGEISDPKKPITGSEEQQNLQAIYKEGSSARDILKINTVFQENLNIQEYLGFDVVGKRFGVDWKKSFEENIKNLNA